MKPISLPRLSLPRLPIAKRLVIINILLGVAIFIVSVVAFRALDEQTVATVALSRVSQAQRYHMHADMLHDNIRADTYSALLSSSEATHLTPHKAQENLRESTRLFGDDLSHIGEIELPDGIHQRNEELKNIANVYFSVAQRIAEIAATNSTRDGIAMLPRFDAAFNDVLKLMEQQTEAMSALVVKAETEATTANEHAKYTLTMASLLANLLGFLLVWLISRTIRRSLQRVTDNATAVARGDLSVRNDSTDGDEVGQLARSIDSMSGMLQEMIGEMQNDAKRVVFDSQLSEALEMADTETAAHGVVTRAMATISPDHPMELLLSDSSRVHLERAAAHPIKGAPGCGVESPFSCPAVRRGLPVVYPHSDALNACPQLRDRACGAVSAVCVPVSFMGRSLGVLHAVGAIDAPMEDEQVSKLTRLGTQAGARVGTVRAFERTQVQASTDSLTGLSNRRTVEYQARELLKVGKPFALVMADLDKFKSLNDRFGHQAGDNALKTFATAARSVARDTDFLARWGGEEFIFLLPNASATQGLEWSQRLRKLLADSLASTGAAVFTASFGIADSTMGASIEDLTRIADSAMYASKDQGRDRSTIGSAKLKTDDDDTRHATEHDSVIDLRLLAGGNG